MPEAAVFTPIWQAANRRIHATAMRGDMMMAKMWLSIRREPKPQRIHPNRPAVLFRIYRGHFLLNMC